MHVDIVCLHVVIAIWMKGNHYAHKGGFGFLIPTLAPRNCMFLQCKECAYIHYSHERKQHVNTLLWMVSHMLIARRYTLGLESQLI